MKQEISEYALVLELLESTEKSRIFYTKERNIKFQIKMIGDKK